MAKVTTVQLTERDKSAVWKTKNQETGKTEFIEMADMEDRHLQAALIIAQKRQLKSFFQFINDSKRIVQIKQAAKNRNQAIQDIDNLNTTFLACKYCELR